MVKNGSTSKGHLKNSSFRGVPIVLTSPPNEISDYNLDPFVAFLSSFPSNFLLKRVVKRKFLTPRDNGDKSAVFVPYGLRKVESLLLNEYSENDVVVTHPDNLDRFVGPETKAVGISTMDPMGLAYATTTYSSILAFGGESINSVEFRQLVNHPSIQKYNPKIIVGGGGAWQIDEANKLEEYGIDTLVLGEAENSVVDIFNSALSGEKLPKILKPKRPAPDSIPLIRNAATYGVVEISRGCGRGCQFCSPTMRHKYSFPLEHIMKEVKVNVDSGSKMIFLATEDIFLYKSQGKFIPNREEVVKMVSTIANYPGVEYIQPAHSSLAPVVYDPQMVQELSQILLEKTRWTPEFKSMYRNKFISVEIGIETGSVRLMKRYMKGKALPYKIDDWPSIVTQAVGIMNDYDWYPLATIMTGLPDETEEDTIATLELVDDLSSYKMFITPILFVPLKDCLLSDARRVSLDHLTDLQWDFIGSCFKYNFDFWLPHARWRIMTGTLLSYIMYYSWKHGPKAFYPMTKASGLADTFIGKRIFKGCDPRMCKIDKGTIEHEVSDINLRTGSGGGSKE
ncbi:MAG: B12-binding domain-containing radical SAM protein [Thermoplasmata archaeon]|nr:MAG: B12-binding domain-containing radical SAM protein [Thermoplasmata archaeon]